MIKSSRMYLAISYSYLYGNEPENCHIFSVANEWLQNLITNILSLFKEKILIILKNYVPLEERELTPVESDKVKSLALLALQVGTLDEAGNHSQVTSSRNVLGL